MFTQTHTPVTGTTFTSNTLSRSRSFDSLPLHQFTSRSPHVSPEHYRSGINKLPKLNFHSFDGENPELWQSNSESYFKMYEIDRSMWVRVATMYFTDAAARWLQSVEQQLASVSWEHFYRMVHDRFGCDQHKVLIRQLFNICQSGSVDTYIA